MTDKREAEKTQDVDEQSVEANKPERDVFHTPEEWKKNLNFLEYSVLRMRGTEKPGTGALLYEDRPGVYQCRGCGAPIFRSETKFDSGCGWPSFFDPFHSDAVETREDDRLFPVRTEVICARCGSHLGHVFPDAPDQPTGLRYCINSVSMQFVPDAE
ncbi:MAG: peptide-methionine (R)-S-oxide reductase MsrB [Actinomycetaceae bacterium]|nr:peptide-methionine (R)-S-oxide reductase MsrB [Actinomycetaceae bacterium]MDY6083512.1 peptide-methionine (R)-S-oxide reductase MsrB [Actinomycetaceae bacterium]